MATKRSGKETKHSKVTETNAPKGDITNDKLSALEPFRESAVEAMLSTNQGTRINDNQNSLKAGARGPSLLEDFILREKITHSTMSAFPSAWCTRVAPPPTATSESTNRCPR